MGDLVDVKRDGRIARVVMHRKGNNAIAEDLMQELAAAFQEVGDDHSVRAIVLASEYEKYFSVGADLTSLAGIDRESPNAADEIALFMRRMNHHFNAIERCPRPVIAAINGHALGGGSELTLCCDFRVMVKDAVRRGYDLRLDEGLEIESQNFARAALSTDAAIGIMSFLTKQEPEFTGS